jgi:parallel beta-helix repeat protein
MGVNYKRTLFALLVLVVATSTVAAYFLHVGERHTETEIRYPVAFHSSITVASDSDFTRPEAGSGCQCVRSGSGREDDPYLISDWIVNSTGGGGVIIYGTRAHFVIARLVLQGSSAESGMYISEAENGIVKDCSITGWLHGVYVFSSSNLAFVNNTVGRNEFGIQLEASQSNRLIDNRFDENGELGIFLRGSDSVVVNNSAARNGFGGINVDGTAGPANSNQLEGNNASGNAVYGIGVWRGAQNVLTGNTAMHNGGVGIMLTDESTENLIEANIVMNNSQGGIVLIGGSSENTVRENTARGNGDGVIYFDMIDTGSNNMWQSNKYDTKNPDSIN